MKDETGNDHGCGVADLAHVARRLTTVSLILTLGYFIGCSGNSGVPVPRPFSAAKHRMIRVQRCVDQSAYSGAWDLAARATESLRERVMATGRFDISAEPGLVFTCDVEGIVDRNAVQRGSTPLWSISEVRVTVLVWEKPADDVLAVFRGFAEAPRSGMFLGGEQRRLVDNAIDDVAKELEAWVNGRGKNP